MKIRICLGLLCLIFPIASLSQQLVDSCITSVSFRGIYGTILAHLDTVVLTKEKRPSIVSNGCLLNYWDGNRWRFGRLDRNGFRKFPKELAGAKVFEGTGQYLPFHEKGVPDFWENSVAFRINHKLKRDSTYTFILTYSATGWYNNQFIPRIYTGKKPTTKGAFPVGIMKKATAAGWVTDTISYTAIKKQRRHKWIIVESKYRESNGALILDPCVKLPPGWKEIADSIPSNDLLTDTASLQPGTSVTLKNVYFETGRAALLPASYSELDKLFGYLKNHPSVKIEIRGHTDNTGSEANNMQLSEDRAKAVVDYLLSKGIEQARLSYRGYGSTAPVASNDTEEGRARNRRVEFVLSGK